VSEVRSIIITLASSAFFSLILLTMMVARTPWLMDADGLALAWLLLASAPLAHELGHRAAFRRQGVNAVIASPLSFIFSFGGAVRVPEPVDPGKALKGAVAGPLVTIAYTVAALVLSQWFKPVSTVALLLSITVALSGAPRSSDAKYMNLRWRIAFIAVGAVLTAASALNMAYLIKYG
jgi:hypothetical protein